MKTEIEAPIEWVFELARDLPLHTQTVWKHTRERIVEAPPSGMAEAGGRITFEARHLGVRQRLTVQVTEFRRPFRFVDEQVRGAFKMLRHEHDFAAKGTGTVMTDTLVFTAPFGWLGRLTDKLILKRYMHRFLLARNAAFKHYVESRHPSADPGPAPDTSGHIGGPNSPN